MYRRTVHTALGSHWVDSDYRTGIIKEGQIVIIEDGADDDPSPPLLMFFSGRHMEMTQISNNDN